MVFTIAMVELLKWCGWPDLVFHVLAHCAATAALAPSVYDPIYVDFARRHCGPAEQRNLVEDAGVLGELLPSHRKLATAQLLAWLFSSSEQAQACATCDLGALASHQVGDAAMLAPLIQLGPAAEVLRCAVELERPFFARLPSVRVDEARLLTGIEHAVAVAPALADCRVMVVRSLRLRGRIRGRNLWVGAPSSDPGPALEHVIWQASHEASVREVSSVCNAHGLEPRFDVIERSAVVLLAERAAAAGRRSAHQKWLNHFGAGAPSTDRATLEAVCRRLVELCRDAAG